jgi:hypothetical protein
VQVVVVLAAQLAQTDVAGHVGKKAETCFNEELDSLKVAQMRSPHRDEAVQELRPGDRGSHTAQDKSAHRMANHHDAILLLFLFKVKSVEVGIDLRNCHFCHFN